MADEPTDDDRQVLSSLPSSRPARRSAKRGERGAPRPAAGPGAGRPKRTAPERRHVPPAGYATPAPERTSPGTGELLGGAVRAAGEVAQLGAGVGGRLAKGTLRRLTGR
jgi:hypothetical protein